MSPERHDGTWSVFARYLMLQAPGWVAVGLALVVVEAWLDLSAPALVAIAGLWIIKDLVLFPFVRKAYERGSRDASTRLVGARGVTRDRLDPEGWVRVGSELWRAELSPGQPPIEAGRAVRVREVQGMTVRVEAEGDAPGRSTPGTSP